MPLLFSAKKIKTEPKEGVCLRIITDYPSMGDVDKGYLFSDNEGKLLARWLHDSGFSAFNHCFEKISLLSTPDSEKTFSSRLATKASGLGVFGPVEPGKYLSADMYAEAMSQIAKCEAKPANITVVLGSLASRLWSGESAFKLEKNRGAIAVVRGQKTLYTFHPRHVRVKWKDYTLAFMDVIKAVAASDTPDHTPAPGFVLVPESLADIREIVATLRESDAIAVDIETIPVGGTVQIDLIGFAPKGQATAYVIPIFDRWKLGRSIIQNFGRATPTKYAGKWSFEEELVVWDSIAEILSRPECTYRLQNGIYDAWVLWRVYGIPIIGGWDDSMIMHHCLHCELPKGLDVLGSLYTDYSPWKQMKQFGRSVAKKGV